MTETAVKKVERVKVSEIGQGTELQVKFRGDHEYTKVTVTSVELDNNAVFVIDENGMQWGLEVYNGLLGSHVKR